MNYLLNPAHCPGSVQHNRVDVFPHTVSTVQVMANWRGQELVTRSPGTRTGHTALGPVDHPSKKILSMQMSISCKHSKSKTFIWLLLYFEERLRLVSVISTKKTFVFNLKPSNMGFLLSYSRALVKQILFQISL